MHHPLFGDEGGSTSGACGQPHARVPVCRLGARPGKRGGGRCGGAETRASLEKSGERGRRARTIRRRAGRKPLQLTAFECSVWSICKEGDGTSSYVEGASEGTGRESWPCAPGECGFEGRGGEVNLGTPTRGEKCLLWAWNAFLPALPTEQPGKIHPDCISSRAGPGS